MLKKKKRNKAVRPLRQGEGRWGEAGSRWGAWAEVRVRLGMILETEQPGFPGTPWEV